MKSIISTQIAFLKRSHPVDIAVSAPAETGQEAAEDAVPDCQDQELDLGR
jgi:hypothetical protein